MAESAIREHAQQHPEARNHPGLEWFRSARFGMFIHWGLYAIPAGIWEGRQVEGIGEWIMNFARIPIREYEPLAARFNPTEFDAEAWVALARRAGQRYIVLTAKHHDGFCMFRTRHTSYNIVDATPFGRDPVEELAEECRRQGVKLGLYYSQTQDWHHPGGDGNEWDFDQSKVDFEGYLENYVKPQVRELLTQYGPLCLIWFDTPRRITVEQSRELVDLVHELQPNCLVNGRIGNGLGDYSEAGDNKIPDGAQRLDFETPATINDTWGFKVEDRNWKSSTDLIRKLVDITSKGGNYLLNVGPTATGEIPHPSIERLEAVGHWLDTNGEAIYGAGAGPVQGAGWCRTTAVGDRVYVHVLEWPAGGRLQLPLTDHQVRSATLLSDGRQLAVEKTAEGVAVAGPAEAPDPAVSVVRLDVGPAGS